MNSCWVKEQTMRAVGDLALVGRSVRAVRAVLARVAGPRRVPAVAGTAMKAAPAVSVVFQEVVRDDVTNAPMDIGIEMGLTTAHEVGHQLGLARTTSGHRDSPTNLMMAGVVNGADKYLYPEDIAALRDRVHSAPVVEPDTTWDPRVYQ